MESLVSMNLAGLATNGKLKLLMAGIGVLVRFQRDEKGPGEGTPGRNIRRSQGKSQAATAVTFLKMVSSTLQGLTTIGIVRHGS
jgi:hypothetical protein